MSERLDRSRPVAAPLAPAGRALPHSSEGNAMPRPLLRHAAVCFTITAAVAGAIPAGAADAPNGASPTGTIVVHVAGDRDGTTADPRGVPGVTVHAYADAVLSTSVGTCTTDVTGTCTITGLDPGTYHVAPGDEPIGDGTFQRVGTLTTSLDGDVAYADAVAVGEGSPETRPLAVRRRNPPFPSRCGIDLTLLYDLSGSIDAEEMTTMKRNSQAFVDALAATPSRIAISSFATAAPAAGNANLPHTSVAESAGVTAVKAAVDALAPPAGDGQFTNWDAAFRSVDATTQLVVLFTDGNPTTSGVPAVYPPVITAFEQVEAGVLSANAVKARGTRVLAVGVGDLADLSEPNLAAVSGPTAGDDYAVTTFALVDQVFRKLASDLCPKPPPTTTPPATVTTTTTTAPPAPTTIPAAPVPPRFTG